MQHDVSEAEQQRWRAAVDDLLKRAEHVVPDPNPPRLRGQEAEIEQMIVEKFRKQGFGV
jgi:hypothetical protein